MYQSSVMENDNRLDNAIYMREKIMDRNKQSESLTYGDSDVGENDETLLSLFQGLVNHIDSIIGTGLNNYSISHLKKQREIILGEMSRL